MFGFGRVECPLDDETRAWVESGVMLLSSRLDAERLKRPVIEPTREFFPFDLDGTPEAATRMFHHVCKIMDIDPARTRLVFEEADAPLTNGSLDYDWASDGAAGTYRQDSKGRHLVMVRDDLLDDSLRFVAVAAHELAHAVMHDSRMLEAEDDVDVESEEELTDMLTVLYGMGIFTANASLHERQYDANIGMSGWGWSRTGYLDFPLWAHVHAVFAYLREERDPPWARHLRLDIRALFKRSLKFLWREGLADSPAQDP
jgi:hypothetical protein